MPLTKNALVYSIEYSARDTTHVHTVMFIQDSIQLLTIVTIYIIIPINDFDYLIHIYFIHVLNNFY
jgi:hypothetical protein